jgi:hypothetical protein
MKKLAAIAVVPFFAGFLFAQAEVPQATQTQTTRTQTTTTTTNMEGTLLDAGCYTTHTHKTDTNSNAAGSSTTETRTVATNCPVTAQTTSFGLMTPEGKYVAFDPGGNARVVELVKSNKEWQGFMSEHKPVTVHVIGTADGGTIVVKEIK